MRLSPAASYTLRRLALFLATLALAVPLLSTNFFVALLVATVVSSVLSYFLLAGQREAMARAVTGKMQALNNRLDARAAAEDALLDAAEQQRSPGRAGAPETPEARRAGPKESLS